MKKIISAIICISMLAVVLPVTSLALNGNGTEENPYLVSSANDLNNIHNDLSAYYKLTGDINMDGVVFTPIGNENEGAFTGTIDGNGFSIKNLSIDLPDDKYVGLVGYLEGSIKNVILDEVTANGYRYVGGIAGYAAEESTIYNCDTYGTIQGTYQIIDISVGGIVGYNKGDITSCNNSGDVSATSSYAGGIAGYNYGTISDCGNSGYVSASSSSYAGGIVGENRGTISDCSNSGYFSASSYAGGIVGYNYGTISDCSNSGTVSSSHAGGIAGYNRGTISGCNNSETVSAASPYPYAGGIVGENRGTISDCSNSGYVSASSSYSYFPSYAGGIAGYNGSGGTISNCSNCGTVSSKKSFAGGIAGYNESTIKMCFNTYTQISAGGSSRCYNSLLGFPNASIGLDVKTTQQLELDKSAWAGAISYESSDTSVAEVSQDGIVSAKHGGTAIITASTVYQSVTYTATCVITVKQPAKVIALNKNAVTAYVGSTYQLSSTVFPADTTDTVSWTSSNTSCVTVSNTGLITGINTGTATISAKTSNGLVATCYVTVKEAMVAPTSVTLSDTSITLAPEDAKALTTAIAPSNATETALAWSSSDENVAIVNNSGVVTAVAAGYATITATTVNGYSHECSVQVIAANGASFIAKSTKAASGDIAEYTVSAVKNPGMSYCKLSIDFDNTLLTPVEIVKSIALPGSFSTNLNDEDRTTLNIVWYNQSNYTDNADLFTVKFKVADGAVLGSEIPVNMSYDSSDIKNSAGSKLAFFLNNTSVCVANPLLGDVYEDEEIDFHDILALSRNITGLESFTSRQLMSADTESDGVIDIKDNVRLLQHVVGWTGAELFGLMSLGGSGDDMKIAVDSVKANDAGEADIGVSVENNSGIAGFKFEINYNDDEVELLSITPNTDILNENFSTNLGTDDKLYATWYNADNMYSNGTLFTIRVKYKDVFNGSVSPITITPADNNMCNQERENVISDYTDGYIMTDSYIKNNEVVAADKFTCDMFFDNTFDEQSATAIVAFYDESGKLLTTASTDISVTNGKVSVEIPVAAPTHDNYKVFVWESLNSMMPLPLKARI